MDFGRLRRAAEFPDLAEDLLGGPAGRPALMFFDPHGVLPAVSFPGAIKERPVGDVNHKPSGQDLWANAHFRSRRVSGGCCDRLPIEVILSGKRSEIMVARTDGTVDPERRKTMSGLEFVTGLASGTLPLNTIARTLGYEVVEAESGRVAITLDPTDAHLNPWGTVHGGLTATLLDSCMGLAIQTMLGKGVGSTTLEFKFRSCVPSPGDRPHQGRGQGSQLRTPGRHGRGPAD